MFLGCDVSILPVVGVSASVVVERSCSLLIIQTLVGRIFHSFAPQSSVAIVSPSSSDTAWPQNANVSSWCHFGGMESGVRRHRALGYLDPPHPAPRSCPSPSPIQSRLTSVSCYLDGSLLAVDGLGTSLINEMYDNVISLIE